MSEVTDALEGLAAGRLPLEQVAAMFAARRWPAAVRPGDRTLADEAFPPEPAGSFTEVSVAFSSGLISAEQYGVLARAASRAA